MDRETTTASPRFLRDAAAVPAPLRAELRQALEPRESRWPALGRLLVSADVIAAACAGSAAAAVGGAPVAAFTAAVVAAWCLVAWVIGLYAGDDLRDWASGLSAMPKLLVTALALSWPLQAFAAWLGATHPAVAALGAMALTAPVAGVGRTLARAAVHRDAAHRQRVLIIGSGVIATRLEQQLRSHGQFGLDCVGFLDDDPHPELDAEVPHLGGLDDLCDVLDRHDVDRVAIAFSRASHQELLAALRECRDRRVSVDIVPRLFEFLDHAPGVAQMGALPLISVGVPRLSRPSRALKRVLDVVGATAGVVVMAPLLALIAIAIRIESPGPVFFRQTRMGRGGKSFKVFKFRSMYQDAELRKRELSLLNDIDDGVMFKIHRDPRVTRVGRLLRRTSFDEMPQLFNVIRGEMSLVGPRPLILQEANTMLEGWHARRLDLRPGMTGPWQVTGRSDLTYQEMLRLDYSYVSGWTLARDVEMLLATIPAVLSGRGAY
jgi:exopolysaccharide biosynthesis polyprenyl glycosylphosphotransferase